ncbi:PAS domain S-box protein, partial [candidate division WOR-3 bacterium]|nr:PAS domain S-box protein [candidate division WOR-3 bacterium]
KIVAERSAARSKKQNVPGIYTIEVVGKNGKNIPVEISVSVMQYMGNPATLAIFRNISDRRKAETMLRQSEGKYRLLSENIPVAVYSVLPDKHLTTLFVSHQIYFITGYKAREFLGDPKLWWNIIHPNDRAFVRQTWSKVKKKRTKIDIEYRIITKNKTTKWLCERAVPLFCKRKTIVQYNGYREEITQRKTVQEQLSRSEVRYRSIVENTGVGVATTNTEGKFTFVNERLCRMIGYRKKDMINKPFTQFLHPDDRKQIMDILLAAPKNRTRRLDLEFRIVHKNGGIIHIYSSPTLKLIEGKIVGFSVIIQDITRLKKTEEEIKQRNEELATLNSLSAVISQTLDLKEILGTAIDKLLEIIHFNVGGIYLYDATDMTLKLTTARGLSRKQMHAFGEIQLDQRTLNYANEMARRDRFLIPTSTLPGILQRLPSILNAANKEKFNLNHMIVSLLHAKKHIEGLLVAVSETNFTLDKKQQRLFESIIRQITVAILNAKLYEKSKHEINERIKSEQQIKQSLKEKEALLKEVHHRVKNNLQIISSLLNLQAGHISDEHYRNIFKESQNRIRSMVLVHEKLYQSMDLTRIQTQTYLAGLLHHLFQSYGVQPDSIKLELETQNTLLNIDTAIPFGLIINELVSNSLKYAFKISRDRVPMIRVTLSRNRNSLRQLCVSDNGIGIPETIDTATSSTLGLQLVHALVEQLNGTITIDRTEGTSFTITFKNK